MGSPSLLTAHGCVEPSAVNSWWRWEAGEKRVAVGRAGDARAGGLVVDGESLVDPLDVLRRADRAVRVGRRGVRRVAAAVGEAGGVKEGRGDGGRRRSGRRRR